MARSIILGAGVAGLAAAHTLQRLGESDPLVLEKKTYPGGLAATMEWQGCRMDLGPHRIHTVYPHVKELIQSLVGNDLVLCKRTSQMYLDGKWLDYPPRAGEMLRQLGALESTRIALSALLGRGRGIWSKLAGRSEESYAEYLEHRFGKRLRELIFDPFAEKVYREQAEDLDSMVARVRLASQGLLSLFWEAVTGQRKSAVKTFLYPNLGFGLISSRLTEKIIADGGEVLLGRPAVRIRHTGGLIRSVEYEDQDEKRRSEDSDRLISTVPLIHLLEMLEPQAPQSVKAAAKELVYADSFLVYTLVDKQPLTPNCWMYFPGEETIFTRVFELYHFSEELVPEGKSCLCSEIPARPTDPIQYGEEEELKSRVWDGFIQTGLARDAECLDQVVLRVPKAYPIYRVGYREPLNQVLNYLAGFGNLLSAGRHGLFHYNNSDHSMEMGRLAAEYGVSSPKNSEGWYARRDEFDRYRIVD